MFKQESSASSAQRISRIEALRSSEGAHAFDLDLKPALYDRPGRIGGASTCRKAVSTLSTGRRESVGTARCSS